MGRKIVILGGGESGTGAAVLARKKGFQPFLSDSGPLKPVYRELLKGYEIGFEEGGHGQGLTDGTEEIIKSPGIPDNIPVLQLAREKGIPVISEIEFAGRFTKAFTVCVTGSNGKTTTSSLIYHIMKKGGLNAGLAGNVGTSFARMVADHNFDYYVLELSSFQLDGIFRFKPDVAVILNITPDHLDRYDNDIRKYASSKFRITDNLSAGDALIWCMDDPVTAGEMQGMNPDFRQFPFSLSERMPAGAYLENNKMIILSSNNRIEMTLEELALKGKHNIYNSMAAGIAGQLLRIRKEVIRESLSDFQGIEHRLETVIKVRGIEFINDSKATNVNSTWYALESMSGNVVWIAGGIDKGNDYSALNELVREKVRAIVCLGKDNSKIINAFKGLVPLIVGTSSMEEAVGSAYHLARKDDTVLLSPACASFDLFENYEDRGRQFKNCVRNL
jgi:UDP-N-acetylmuramoylalanine--D-glutamate ligase